jgi:hypothetical protein
MDAKRNPQAVAYAIGAPNNLTSGQLAKVVNAQAVAAQRTADEIAKREVPAEASVTNTLLRGANAQALQALRAKDREREQAARQNARAVDPVKQQKLDDELKAQNLYNSAPACVALYGTYANFATNYRKFGNRLPCLGSAMANTVEGL